jgi:hypothetical protein
MNNLNCRNTSRMKYWSLQTSQAVIYERKTSVDVTVMPMKEYVGRLIRRTACARAQFSVRSSTTNAHSETGKVAVCCQNLPLGALSSRSAPSVLVGELFKKFGLFFNTPCTNSQDSHAPSGLLH